jgi:hypothetical protein
LNFGKIPQKFSAFIGPNSPWIPFTHHSIYGLIAPSVYSLWSSSGTRSSLSSFTAVNIKRKSFICITLCVFIITYYKSLPAVDQRSIWRHAVIC